MRKAASAVFCYQDLIYIIERQDYLTSFPGYTAFPGGKVDKSDEGKLFLHDVPNVPKEVLVALGREMREEVQFEIETSQVKVSHLGNALTPKFNPYRFDTYFFKIELKEKVDFKLDTQEFKKGEWITPKAALERYEKGHMLAVPPTVLLLRKLMDESSSKKPFDLNLKYDDEQEIPMIESVCGVKQFLPLSNTLPPANRTNCFLIGGVLIDPSPKDDEEYKKLLSSLKNHQVESIFLTHHHPDHHENSVQLAKELGVSFQMSSYTKETILKKWGPSYFEELPVKVLKEGDILTDCLGHKVGIYSVPGHDEGQLAPMREDGAWMIVSDLIQGVGTVVIGGEEGDMIKYFASLEKVIKLNPKVIYPSHGIGLGGVSFIEKTLKHRQMREGQVKEMLQEGKSPQEMLTEIYTDIHPKLYPYALMNIHSHIKKINSEK